MNLSKDLENLSLTIKKIKAKVVIQMTSLLEKVTDSKKETNMKIELAEAVVLIKIVILKEEMTEETMKSDRGNSNSRIKANQTLILLRLNK